MIDNVLYEQQPKRTASLLKKESQGGYTAGNGGGSYPRRQDEEERIEMEILHEEPELQSSQQQQQQQQQQLLTHATTGHHEQHDQQKDAPHITNCQDATIHLNKVNGSIAQDVTEELIFESIENTSGNGSDYGSCEEKDPVYEEVETEEEIYADCSIKAHGTAHPLETVGSPVTTHQAPLAPLNASPATRSPVDSSITSDLSRDMLASPNSSQHSHYDHSNSALSDPECDSDLLLKCSSPEEEDDLLGEIQCKQDIEDIGQIQERAGDQGQSTQETQKEQELTLQTKQQEREQDTKERNKTPDPLKTLRPPMSVDPKKLMPQALKPICGEETIIAREIRLQKEREEEIQKERLEARRKAEEKIGHLSSSTRNLLDDRPSFKAKSLSYKPLATSTPKCIRVGDSGASKIEDEIRQLKQREEELRRVRENLQMRFQKDRELKMQNQEVQTKEEKEGDKKFEIVKATTASVPRSVISPSLKHTGRRQIKVRPLDDGDEVPETTVYLNETPIEREIRLARERDEALRREKGLLAGKVRQDSIDSSSILSERSTTSSTSSSCSDLPPTTSRNAMRHTVTSKIQKEIEEQTRKEIELKKEGVIRTISVERSDSKVAKIGQADNTDSTHTPRQRTFSSGSSSSGTSSLTYTPFRRPGFGPVARGISMQKFIASQGRDVVPTGPIEPRWTESSRSRLEIGSVNLERKSVFSPRRGLITAESKIQQELKLFKERESELRRMRKLGGSQPNLSNLSVLGDISADDDDNKSDDLENDGAKDGQDTLKGAPLYPSLRQRVLSNPNLLDCVDEPLKAPEPSAVNTRKKSAMVVEWENRIRQGSKK
ncbi:uncharacterized protein LOC111244514 isoform X3 [Varroa destructor]|uniref:A-kinase anchor protein 2 C-terminal domain-containing protein n=1 Tax=Varroa destructor TaxID=109461 RepID=A0A7M7JK53_VARDE|nr:uncharacterized protein LOC111244514 isoform X3 [Varroa destructor]